MQSLNPSHRESWSAFKAMQLWTECFPAAEAEIKQLNLHIFFFCICVCKSGDYVRKNVPLVAANWLLQLILNGMK